MDSTHAKLSRLCASSIWCGQGIPRVLHSAASCASAAAHVAPALLAAHLAAPTTPCCCCCCLGSLRSSAGGADAAILATSSAGSTSTSVMLRNVSTDTHTLCGSLPAWAGVGRAVSLGAVLMPQ